MKMRLAVALATGLLTLAACGGDDGGSDGGSGVESDDPAAVTDNETGAGESGFDESTLPDDFPRDLIPPSYDFGTYTELGATRTGSFESTTPVDESIAHYTGLLGEPTLAVEGEAGERSVQWQESEWLVSVIGKADESIIGISKIEG